MHAEILGGMEDYYFQNVFHRERIEFVGRRRYTKITELFRVEIESIAEQVASTLLKS